MTSASPAKRWQRTLGIVGGLGPHAHIAFEKQLLAAVGAVASDQDYPPWIVSSLPATPDRTQALIADGPTPVPALVASLRNLEGRADFAVVACNTAHAFLEEAQAQVKIPVLNVIRETVEELRARLPLGSRIGLLATTGTLRAAVYERTSAAAVGEDLVWRSLLDEPSRRGLQDSLVMSSIYGSASSEGRGHGGLKAGLLQDPETGEPFADRLGRAVDELLRQGCSAVVLGCSEIPLALTGPSGLPAPLVDPMQIAADRCLRIASGELPLPVG
ncbi:MAG: aspartate/glutamate racemase family protein [Acidobacteriota bacterium]